MRYLFCTALLLAAAGSDRSIAAPPNTADWLVGTWQKTLDEDNAPPDKMLFRADGTFVSYGKHCEERVNPYFIHDGNVFLVVGIPDKGPVALVFRPSQDRQSLTFTSPRTLNNARYEKRPPAACVPQE